MLQISLIIVAFLLLIIPTGNYLYHIATGQHTFADPFFDKIDNGIYKLSGIKKEDMSWKKYAFSMLMTNAVMAMLGYFVLRIQSIPLLNPNGISGMESFLSFNTIISFMTNTNLQHYAGETHLSYLGQIVVIIFMMFTSAATGFSVAMAFIRGLSGKVISLGNFYVDLTRIITRVLLPFSIVGGLLLVSQGVPQNFTQNVTIQTIEGTYQDIAMGPVASLEIIKHLGTNGGGFFGANSATPFENPNVVTNMIEMLAMMLLPGSIVIAFGHMVSNRRKEKTKEKASWIGRQARPLFIVMLSLFFIGLSICLWAEKAGNPILESIGLNQDMGSMEGKETRFGIEQSALFTTVTTAFTTGSINNMHDTLTPIGGAVPLVNMMLNVVFGGKGVGLMNMVLYGILAVFICGLMIGRTPEYLGKKIEGKEMKLTALGIIIHPLIILSFSALALATSSGVEGITNPGFHGLTQVIYEFSSSAANNGSGFEGLADNTNFWNITTGLAMFFGRYLTIIIQLAIASSLMMKRQVNESIGTLKTDTGTFTVALFMVIMIIAALTFFPVVVLGPIAEHLTLWK
ncbi:K+-transporting ATPase ATPase A chain [Carnobacterium iners]|uniref:Potassium-transporting ATPase potassium-binding subunit n=1 Tax=Carnobacterium iners TaxID=1073423 RepID=A0A1X7MXU2_9LACT|nr:potassium-transporting ATPase subunit KdpA [Carnobacterium iners]SEK17679.1 K+-transporting ATPase ATPase A chain [Carnobacterium iners]SMH29029.1 K+-transporting ATPase ATPase A chain [Carnobacterium iners]